MPLNADPFTRVHSQIWAALIASSDWTDLVKAGNRLDVTGDGTLRNVVKGGRAPSDFNEVMIDQGRYAMLPFGSNSMIVNATQAYILRIASGQTKVININSLKWQTLRALHAWGPHLRLPNLVNDWRIEDAADAPAPPDPNQPGYFSAMSIVVEMYVPKATP